MLLKFLLRIEMPAGLLSRENPGGGKEGFSRCSGRAPCKRGVFMKLMRCRVQGTWERLRSGDGEVVALLPVSEVRRRAPWGRIVKDIVILAVMVPITVPSPQ